MHHNTVGWLDCCWSLAIIQRQLNCEMSSWTNRSWHLGHLSGKKHSALKDDVHVHEKQCNASIEMFLETETPLFPQGQVNIHFCISCVTMRTMSCVTM